MSCIGTCAAMGMRTGAAIVAAFAAISWPTVAAPNPQGAAAVPADAAAGDLPTIRYAARPWQVPDVHFTDASGARHALSEFRGRVVLLNVWATWCTPCRVEMPALDRLQAKLGGPAFEVVAVSLDHAGLAAVRPFFEQLDLKALRMAVADEDDLIPKLHAVGVPLTLLVDRQGRERWRRLGPAEWDRPALVRLIRREIDGGGDE